MENIRLQVTMRDGAGKGAARKQRALGRVPAILYGHKKDPVDLTVGEADMRGLLQGNPDSAIVELYVDGGDSGTAIVRDVQRHPATGRLLHIDFQRINLDEKVRVDVHVELLGDPIGVKEQGGIMEHGIRVVNVTCLPNKIPESIVIDVSGLNVHDSIKVKDVVDRYPDLEFGDDLETTLANVLPPRLEKVETEEEVAEGEEAAEAEAAAADEEEKEES